MAVDIGFGIGAFGSVPFGSQQSDGSPAVGQTTAGFPLCREAFALFTVVDDHNLSAGIAALDVSAIYPSGLIDPVFSLAGGYTQAYRGSAHKVEGLYHRFAVRPQAGWFTNTVILRVRVVDNDGNEDAGVIETV